MKMVYWYGVLMVALDGYEYQRMYTMILTMCRDCWRVLKSIYTLPVPDKLSPVIWEEMVIWEKMAMGYQCDVLDLVSIRPVTSQREWVSMFRFDLRL